MTFQSADRISHATGISIDWLLENDTKAPPVAIDNTPFTADTFARFWHLRNLSAAWQPFPLSTTIRRILMNFYAAETSGRGQTAHFHLSQFSEMMNMTFGQPEDMEKAADYCQEIISDVATGLPAKTETSWLPDWKD